MARSKPLQDPIANGFVDRIVEDWNRDLEFATGVLPKLGASNRDILDLLLVMESGVTTSLEKESPHETTFERFGTLEDGTSLSVMFAFDPHLRGLTIIGFSEL